MIAPTIVTGMIIAKFTWDLDDLPELEVVVGQIDALGMMKGDEEVIEAEESIETVLTGMDPDNMVEPPFVAGVGVGVVVGSG